MSTRLTADEVIARAGRQDGKTDMQTDTGATATGAEWKETLRAIERRGGAEYDSAFDPEGDGAHLVEILPLREFLLSLGIPEEDIAQTIEAEKALRCTCNGTAISKNTARERLGERRYWNAMHRAAFHWSACTEDDKGREYGFDCRRYFKEQEGANK